MERRERDCYANPNGNGLFWPGEKFCPLLFDGYLCWGPTSAGHVAEQSCPHAQVGDSIITTLTDVATKICDANGQWYIDPVLNSSSNYSQCDMKLFSNGTGLVDLNIDMGQEFEQMFLMLYPIVLEIQFYGYWISIITLLICVLLLVSLKKLHCARNILHVHLFISFILRATAFLIKNSTLVNGIALKNDLVTHGKDQYITENFHWLCKAVTSTWFYFTQANFMFTLMEGIYLHNLMFVNLFSEKSSVRVYYMCGWGIPLCFIPLWVVMRSIYEDKMCWTTSTNKYISWLTQKPIEISVIINFGLFISITRILCIKINSMYVQHNKVKYRRLIRSTLTLLLIYAVPFAISLVISEIVSHFKQQTIELIWIFCDQIFMAFQGLLMGLIYCLLNSEVRSEVKQKVLSIRYYRDNAYNAKRTRAARTISNTMQFTIPIKDEDLRRHPATVGNCYTYRPYMTSDNL